MSMATKSRCGVEDGEDAPKNQETIQKLGLEAIGTIIEIAEKERRSKLKAGWMELGLSSLNSTQLHAWFEWTLHAEIQPEFFLEFSTSEKATAALAARLSGQSVEPKNNAPSKQNAITVVDETPPASSVSARFAQVLYITEPSHCWFKGRTKLLVMTYSGQGLALEGWWLEAYRADTVFAPAPDSKRLHWISCAFSFYWALLRWVVLNGLMPSGVNEIVSGMLLAAVAANAVSLKIALKIHLRPGAEPSMCRQHNSQSNFDSPQWVDSVNGLPSIAAAEEISDELDLEANGASATACADFSSGLKEAFLEIQMGRVPKIFVLSSSASPGLSLHSTVATLYARVYGPRWSQLHTGCRHIQEAVFTHPFSPKRCGAQEKILKNAVSQRWWVVTGLQNTPGGTMAWAREWDASLFLQVSGGRGMVYMAARVAPIAIVGMACRLPQGCGSPAGLWRFLEGRGDRNGEISPTMDWRKWNEPPGEATGKTYMNRGALIEGAICFDTGCFGIPAAEAMAMQPQQRNALEVHFEAGLEASPHTHSVAQPIGVFAASTTGLFHGKQTRSNFSDGDSFSPPGYSTCRTEPSMTVNPACVSSVALYTNRTAIFKGNCDMATAVVVHMLLSVAGYALNCGVNMLSREGRCATFSDQADGNSPGEGNGAFVLKPLSKALRDSDAICAVHHAPAVNEDGCNATLTAPNGPTRKQVIRRAIERAGVSQLAVCLKKFLFCSFFLVCWIQCATAQSTCAVGQYSNGFAPRSIAVSSASTCTVFVNGYVKCCGDNFYGQLGLGDQNDRGGRPLEMGDNLPSVHLGTGVRAISVTAGFATHCALLNGGKVKCWGHNLLGELGLGDNLNRGTLPQQMGDNLPAVKLGTGRTAVQIEAGDNHVCALLDNNKIKCWGSNNRGQLGLGDVEHRGDQPGEMGDALPEVQLGTGRSVLWVAAGMEHTCAKLDNGALKCWGYNAALGLGDQDDRGVRANQMGDFLPVIDLGAGRTAAAAGGGLGLTCAILDTGEVKCWGWNRNGVLGSGNLDDFGSRPGDMGDNLPVVPLGTGRKAKRLGMHKDHVCALLDNGDLKCWGGNSRGQLGLEHTRPIGDDAGEMGDDLPPVQLGTGRNVSMITMGADHSCVVFEDEQIKCWGRNQKGQLGLGNKAEKGSAGGSMGDNLPVIEWRGQSEGQACFPCLEDSVSAANSVDVTECKCNAGYTGTDGGLCTSCFNGQYKPVVGSAACTLCAAGKYQDAKAGIDCSPCPSNTNSFRAAPSLQMCICNAGFSGSGGESCSACAGGKFKPFNGSASCLSCRPGTYSGSTAATTCSACPEFTTSKAASLGIGSCVCAPGYTGADGVCSPCDIGTYKKLNGSAPCTSCEPGKYQTLAAQTVCAACPSGSFSAPGSASLAGCICNGGFTGQNGNCSACNVGEYKSQNGSDACVMCGRGTYSAARASKTCSGCPERSNSLQGSTSVGGCICEAGSSGANGGPCTQCGVGQYKKINGSSVCLDCNGGTFLNITGGSACYRCPANTQSQQGAYICKCKPGYTGPDGKRCNACGLGRYKEAEGSEACSDCAAGTYQNESAVSACMACATGSFSAAVSSLCTCNAGFSGPDGDGRRCVACGVGTFKSGNGPDLCSDCSRGGYAATVGATACDVCPSSSDSLSGMDACTCNAGFHGAFELCTACSVGTYKQVNGSASCSRCASATYLDTEGGTVCTDCPANSLSLGGSPAATGCFCVAGFFGPDGGPCSQCGLGHYKAVNGSSPCVKCGPATFMNESGASVCFKCPTNTVSGEGTTDKLGCVCSPGYSGPNGGPCVACVPGLYKAEAGVQPCSKCERGTYLNVSGESSCIGCPANTFSAAASPAIERCICNVGYTGLFGVHCTACSTGTYKDTNGSVDCSNCPAGTYEENTGQSSCSQCPTGSFSIPGRSSITDCLCNPGFHESPSGCLPCSPATYKPTNGSGECTACHKGTFMNSSGASACYRCPPGSISPVGSDVVQDCICDAGYIGRAGGPCSGCPKGKYKPVNGSGFCMECSEGTYMEEIGGSACLACPLHSTSIAGSENVRRCICSVGYTGPDGEPCEACAMGMYKDTVGLVGCTQCGDGSYQNETGTSACKTCPLHSTSSMGRTDIGECYCKPGNTGPDGVRCTPCSPGQFKPDPGSQSCFDCRPGSFTNVSGATSCTVCPVASFSRLATNSERGCLCNAGYEGADGGPCRACHLGEYKPTNGSNLCGKCAAGSYVSTRAGTVCTSCPPSTHSAPGTAYVDRCLCNAGFTGPDGGNCTACSIGTYKHINGSTACPICAQGTYQNETGTSVCRRCPSDSNSRAGMSYCVCNPGFTGTADPMCTMCQVGTYKPTNGSVSCPLCQPGKYSDTLGATICSVCPMGSFSDRGSGAVQSCICKAGFTGPDGGECSECGKGTYKAVNGSDACVQCEAGLFSNVTGGTACASCPRQTISPPRSESIQACACNSGFTGPAGGVCNACVPGRFKPVVGTVACTVCSPGTYLNVSGGTVCTHCTDPHSLSRAGSVLHVDCLCNAGFSGRDGGNCLACHPGQYKAVNGSSVCMLCPWGTFSDLTGGTHCTSCPPGSSSAAGSPGQASCICNPGFTGPDGGSCLSCAKGSYKPLNGSDACTLCHEGTFGNSTGARSSESCLECDAGTYQDVNGAVSCRPCNAGTYQNETAATSCQACNAGTYQNETATTSCQACPRTTFSSTGMAACICNAGYTGRDGAVCDACPPGSYKAVNGSAECLSCDSGHYQNHSSATACLNCPPHSDSEPFSTSVHDCICAAGFTGGDRAHCEGCVVGKFKPASGGQECQECYAGTYQNVSGASACVSCPASSHSRRNSKGVAACICNAGFTGPGGGQCSACDVGKFKEVNGSSHCVDCSAGFYQDASGATVCQECPLHTFSRPGMVDCLCNAGFYGVHAQGCVACTAGKYKSLNGTGVCRDCEPGTFSNHSAATMCAVCSANSFSSPGQSNCTCNLGYTGPDGSLCAACVPGKFKETSGSSDCVDCQIGTYMEGTGFSVCELCPPHSDSQAGSASVQGCVCNGGFTGPDGESCSACLPGQFKQISGSSQCRSCQEGTYMSQEAATVCSNCQPNSHSPSGSTALSACSCNVGYSQPLVGSCTACVAGTYKTSNGSEPCRLCAPGTFHGGSGGTHCRSCPANLESCSGSSTCRPPIAGPKSCFNTTLAVSYECHHSGLFTRGCAPTLATFESEVMQVGDVSGQQESLRYVSASCENFFHWFCGRFGAAHIGSGDCHFYCHYFHNAKLDHELSSSCAADSDCLGCGLKTFHLDPPPGVLCHHEVQYAAFSSCLISSAAQTSFASKVEEYAKIASNKTCPQARDSINVENQGAGPDVVTPPECHESIDCKYACFTSGFSITRDADKVFLSSKYAGPCDCNSIGEFSGGFKFGLTTYIVANNSMNHTLVAKPFRSANQIMATVSGPGLDCLYTWNVVQGSLLGLPTHMPVSSSNDPGLTFMGMLPTSSAGSQARRRRSLGIFDQHFSHTKMNIRATEADVVADAQFRCPGVVEDCNYFCIRGGFAAEVFGTAIVLTSLYDGDCDCSKVFLHSRSDGTPALVGTATEDSAGTYFQFVDAVRLDFPESSTRNSTGSARNSTGSDWADMNNTFNIYPNGTTQNSTHNSTTDQDTNRQLTRTLTWTQNSTANATTHTAATNVTMQNSTATNATRQNSTATNATKQNSSADSVPTWSPRYVFNASGGFRHLTALLQQYDGTSLVFDIGPGLCGYRWKVASGMLLGVGGKVMAKELLILATSVKLIPAEQAVAGPCGVLSDCEWSCVFSGLAGVGDSGVQIQGQSDDTSCICPLYTGQVTSTSFSTQNWTLTADPELDLLKYTYKPRQCSGYMEVVNGTFLGIPAVFVNITDDNANLEAIASAKATASALSAGVGVAVGLAVATSVGGAVAGGIAGASAGGAGGGAAGGAAAGGSVGPMIAQTQFISMAARVGGAGSQPESTSALSSGMGWANFHLFSLYPEENATDSTRRRRSAPSEMSRQRRKGKPANRVNSAGDGLYETPDSPSTCEMMRTSERELGGVWAAATAAVVMSFFFRVGINHIIWFLQKRKGTEDPTKSTIPFPSWEVQVFLVTFQGLAESAGEAVGSACVSYEIAGFFTLLFLAIFALVALSIILHAIFRRCVKWEHVPIKEAFKNVKEELASSKGSPIMTRIRAVYSAYLIMNERGGWETDEEREAEISNRFSDRWACLYDAYSGGAWWFGFWELAKGLLTALVLATIFDPSWNAGLMLGMTVVDTGLNLVFLPDGVWADFVRNVYRALCNVTTCTTALLYVQEYISDDRFAAIFQTISVFSVLPAMIASLLGPIVAILEKVMGVFHWISEKTGAGGFWGNTVAMAGGMCFSVAYQDDDMQMTVLETFERKTEEEQPKDPQEFEWEGNSGAWYFDLADKTERTSSVNSGAQSQNASRAQSQNALVAAEVMGLATLGAGVGFASRRGTAESGGESGRKGQETSEEIRPAQHANTEEKAKEAPRSGWWRAVLATEQRSPETVGLESGRAVGSESSPAEVLEANDIDASGKASSSEKPPNWELFSEGRDWDCNSEESEPKAREFSIMDIMADDGNEPSSAQGWELASLIPGIGTPADALLAGNEGLTPNDTRKKLIPPIEESSDALLQIDEPLPPPTPRGMLMTPMETPSSTIDTPRMMLRTPIQNRTCASLPSDETLRTPKLMSVTPRTFMKDSLFGDAQEQYADPESGNAPTPGSDGPATSPRRDISIGKHRPPPIAMVPPAASNGHETEMGVPNCHGPKDARESQPVTPRAYEIASDDPTNSGLSSAEEWLGEEEAWDTPTKGTDHHVITPYSHLSPASIMMKASDLAASRRSRRTNPFTPTPMSLRMPGATSPTPRQGKAVQLRTELDGKLSEAQSSSPDCTGTTAPPPGSPLGDVNGNVGHSGNGVYAPHGGGRYAPNGNGRSAHGADRSVKGAEKGGRGGRNAGEPFAGNGHENGNGNSNGNGSLNGHGRAAHAQEPVLLVLVDEESEIGGISDDDSSSHSQTIPWKAPAQRPSNFPPVQLARALGDARAWRQNGGEKNGGEGKQNGDDFTRRQNGGKRMQNGGDSSERKQNGGDSSERKQNGVATNERRQKEGSVTPRQNGRKTSQSGGYVTPPAAAEPSLRAEAGQSGRRTPRQNGAERSGNSRERSAWRISPLGGDPPRERSSSSEEGQSERSGNRGEPSAWRISPLAGDLPREQSSSSASSDESSRAGEDVVRNWANGTQKMWLSNRNSQEEYSMVVLDYDDEETSSQDSSQD